MTFSKETKRAICEAQNDYCLCCLEPIHSIHHKLPNNATNRKLFPLFIHSPMNGAGLAMNCHTLKSHLYRITIEEAAIYETFLRNLTEGVF